MDVESWTGGVRPRASRGEVGLATRQIIYGGIVGSRKVCQNMCVAFASLKRHG